MTVLFGLAAAAVNVTDELPHVVSPATVSVSVTGHAGVKQATLFTVPNTVLAV